MEEDARPTTAIDGAELRELVQQARDSHGSRAALRAALAASPRSTEAIAPIVMIVDRPLKLVDGELQLKGRAEMRTSVDKFRAAASPRRAPRGVDRRATGVAMPAKARLDRYVLGALMFVLAAAVWIAVA